LEELKTRVSQQRLRYVEVRPLREDLLEIDNFQKTDCFLAHSVVLDREIGVLFGSFHKDCVQRKIKRAEREQLRYAEGNSAPLLEHFYGLLLLTNKRRGTPPQPFSWFQNLAQCMGQRLKLRVAYKADRPIAAIITLNFKNRMTYKYGCSDEGFHSLGGMPFLFWNAIQDAKQLGMETFDLGRSDPGHAGLISFKEHFGAKRQELSYWRYPYTTAWTRGSREFKAAGAALSWAPTTVLRAVGSIVYRHMA
jgi:serine/alanine adding enzyme